MILNTLIYFCFQIYFLSILISSYFEKRNVQPTMSNPVTHLPRTIHHFNLTFKHNAFFKAHTLPTEYNRNKIQLLYTYTENTACTIYFTRRLAKRKGEQFALPWKGINARNNLS